MTALIPIGAFGLVFLLWLVCEVGDVVRVLKRIAVALEDLARRKP